MVGKEFHHVPAGRVQHPHPAGLEHALVAGKPRRVGERAGLEELELRRQGEQRRDRPRSGLGIGECEPLRGVFSALGIVDAGAGSGAAGGSPGPDAVGAEADGRIAEIEAMERLGRRHAAGAPPARRPAESLGIEVIREQEVREEKDQEVHGEHPVRLLEQLPHRGEPVAQAIAEPPQLTEPRARQVTRPAERLVDEGPKVQLPEQHLGMLAPLEERLARLTPVGDRDHAQQEVERVTTPGRADPAREAVRGGQSRTDRRSRDREPHRAERRLPDRRGRMVEVVEQLVRAVRGHSHHARGVRRKQGPGVERLRGERRARRQAEAAQLRPSDRP